ncbi:nuclear transport factor 2 family protein [Pseudonocardia xishanensis]|uniref:SnoaL-like domain-containing protein n=1 Tax=Pseudonocardia xishanensis TaxID=630995 RepID=A0ABP8RX37_9PSEU
MTQTTADLGALTRTFYADVDDNDPEVFHRRFSETGAFRFNDLDPVSGPEAITSFVGAWKGNFRSLTHDLERVTVDPEESRVGTEILVTYVFPDGREVKVHGSSFLDYDNGLITGWRVYVDKSALA